MWPWGHLGFGYLVVLPYLLASGSHDDDLAVVALAAGTQFPDMVDKPLAWTFSVLPYGRSLAHSLLTLAVVALVLRRLSIPTVVRRAFLLGWATHTLSDGLFSLLEGDLSGMAFAVWPLLPLPAPETGQSFLAHFRNLSLTGETAFEIFLFAIAGATFFVLRWRDVSSDATRPQRAD
jgi:hypothetical protein